MSSSAASGSTADTLSALCADLAHRLRSPLSVVLNELSVLELEGAIESDAPSKRKLREISALLEQLVVLSREPRLAPVPTSQLPAQLLGEFSAEAEFSVDLLQLRLITDTLKELSNSRQLNLPIALLVQSSIPADGFDLIPWCLSQGHAVPWQLRVLCERYRVLVTESEIVVMLPESSVALMQLAHAQ